MTTTTPVSAGPFEHEPVELGRLLSDDFSGAIGGDEVKRRCDAWMTHHLADAGVSLGAADREIVALLVADGWSVVQIVAGWVTRARQARP